MWFRPVEKPDGFKCYEYILMYVDDVMAIGINPKAVIDRINKYFQIKPESIGKPDIYLGSKIVEAANEHGQHVWGMSASHYVKESVANVEKWLAERGLKLPKGQENPFPVSYRPELDVSP